MHVLTRPRELSSTCLIGETQRSGSNSMTRLTSIRDRFNRVSQPTRAGVACGLLVLVVLVVRNQEVLFHRQWEEGDFALNSILIDRARHFRLLVGNYSRFEFNHPGPALLSTSKPSRSCSSATRSRSSHHRSEGNSSAFSH